MTLTELMPEINNLTEEDKKELCWHLLKELGEDGNYVLGCVHNPDLNIGAAMQDFLEQETVNKIFAGEVPAMVYTPFGMEETALQVMELLKHE